jgi:hypothetical protein
MIVLCWCLQDKNSPAPPPQDAQPLSELQNQMGPPASHDFPGPAAAAGASKPWSSGDRMHGQQPEQDMLLKPLHNTLQQPDAYLLSPEPAGTPQSMDLTNDTMQSAGGLGGFPGFSLRDENDSMELGGHAAAGGGLFAGRDGTYNITGDVPSECRGGRCSDAKCRLAPELERAVGFGACLHCCTGRPMSKAEVCATFYICVHV